jgi:hypothetical protein
VTGEEWRFKGLCFGLLAYGHRQRGLQGAGQLATYRGKSWSPARRTYVSHVDDEENFKCCDCLFVPAKL